MPPTCTELIVEAACNGCVGQIRAIASCRGNVEAGVALARRWIMTGRPGAGTVARDSAERLLAALRERHVQVTPGNGGRVAIVTGHVPGTLNLGYRCAPMVIGLDPGAGAAPRRVVIAEWQAEHVDLHAVLAAIAAGEPGWGGSPTLIGSPQGRVCHTDVTIILDILKGNM